MTDVRVLVAVFLLQSMQEKVNSEEDVTFLLDIVENIIWERIINFYLYFTSFCFLFILANQWGADNLQLQGTSILGNLLL